MVKRKISVNLPKDHFSASQLSSYLRCAKAYEFRYIENRIIPPSLPLVEGGKHHEALHMNNAHKIKKGKDMKAGLVVEAFCDKFSDVAHEIKDWEGETEDTILARGRRMILRYFEALAPKIFPIAAEKKHTVDIAGIPFLMFLDLVEKEHVTDYKTGKRAKSQRDADIDMQLALYSMAEKKSTAAFIYLTKSQNPNVGRIFTKIDKQRIFALERTVLSVVDAVSKGAFPMCDASIVYTCSLERCGYWKLCKGKKPKKSKN